MKSSTTPPRPCSPGVNSAQAIQPTRPQRLEAQQLNHEELNYSTQTMQPRIQFSSGYSSHKASTLRSPSAQFEEINYSTQAMQPKSQFSSGRIAHKASAAQFAELFSSGRPQRPRSLNGSVMKSSTTQLRPCGLRASSAQAE